MDQHVRIKTKISHPDEIATGQALERILEQYRCPLFTTDVLIEKGTIPHSHPVLTLSARWRNEPLQLLKTFVHEQFHWFADQNSKYAECIEYLKSKYPDLGDCNSTGTHPNSFWEHLIVCWNTRHFLMDVITEQELVAVMEKSGAYPLTEPFVQNHFKELKDDLEQYGMAYSTTHRPQNFRLN